MIERNWDLFIIRPNWIRRWVDLQFATIEHQLRPLARVIRRDAVILDVGAGRMPFRGLFPSDCRYVPVDPNCPEHARSIRELESGFRADLVLLLEVLEHVRDPNQLLMECASVLSKEGELVVSVPWSARVHGAPKDYWRWTPDGLRVLFAGAGLSVKRITPRGSDWTTICNKLMVAIGRRVLTLGWVSVPAGIIGVFLAPFGLVLGQLSVWFQIGKNDDPLGYFVVAVKVE